MKVGVLLESARKDRWLADVFGLHEVMCMNPDVIIFGCARHPCGNAKSGKIFVSCAHHALAGEREARHARGEGQKGE